MIIESNEPSVDYIELDSTRNLYNVFPDANGDANADFYIEFTPHRLIKNKDGNSIDDTVKVRESNGSKHF
ncbi:hypothetical protein ACH0BF_04590 [Pseudobacillus sp. 179-B 2D1 NHS]|uniref:hypothetical protein n=1 Tax=Pseudobacillus sp. 179-B 2D1 NHS TaxID=3374292 RepID=UPI00387A29E7